MGKKAWAAVDSSADVREISRCACVLAGKQEAGGRPFRRVLKLGEFPPPCAALPSHGCGITSVSARGMPKGKHGITAKTM